MGASFTYFLLSSYFSLLFLENVLLSLIFHSKMPFRSKVLQDAILSTYIKLPLVIKLFVLYILSGCFTQVFMYVSCKPSI